MSLDGWRNYFSNSSNGIFEIIESAIMVAAADYPQEFRVRRDHIAELLFSCKLMMCSNCERVELGVPANESDGDSKRHECDGENERSKGNSTTGGVTVAKANHVSNYSFGEAEALTDEIEQEGEIFGEVQRIKEVLDNWEDETEAVLYESLRRLELMSLTVDILKTSEVGKAVNRVRKHGSKQICNLSRVLIEGWKEMVDEWVNATTAITADGTPDSVNPSVVDQEEGLPSPPLDEGAFLAAQTATPLEFNEFFSEMDDDGNPQTNVVSSKKHERGRTSVLPNSNPAWQRRPAESSVVHKPKDESMNREQAKNPVLQRRPPPGREENISTEDDIQIRFEAAKRKLRERYEEAENEKKQRRIQVMELGDIPRQAPGHRNAHNKSHSRPSTNRRW